MLYWIRMSTVKVQQSRNICYYSSSPLIQNWWDQQVPNYQTFCITKQYLYWPTALQVMFCYFTQPSIRKCALVTGEINHNCSFAVSRGILHAMFWPHLRAIVRHYKNTCRNNTSLDHSLFPTNIETRYSFLICKLYSLIKENNIQIF